MIYLFIKTNIYAAVLTTIKEKSLGNISMIQEVGKPERQIKIMYFIINSEQLFNRFMRMAGRNGQKGW